MQILWRLFFSKLTARVARSVHRASGINYHYRYNNKTLHFFTCFRIFLCFPLISYFSLLNFSFIFIAIHILFFFARVPRFENDTRETEVQMIRRFLPYLFICFLFFSILFFFLILFIADRRGATFHRCLYNNIRYLM